MKMNKKEFLMKFNKLTDEEKKELIDKNMYCTNYGDHFSLCFGSRIIANVDFDADSMCSPSDTVDFMDTAIAFKEVCLDLNKAYEKYSDKLVFCEKGTLPVLGYGLVPYYALKINGRGFQMLNLCGNITLHQTTLYPFEEQVGLIAEIYANFDRIKEIIQENE